MNVFVTGGTGFVGSEVIQQLVAAGHRVRALVRRGSADKLAVLEKVEVHSGDVTEPADLVGALAGCDAVIHLVGIIRESPDRLITFQRLHVEATRNMLAAARQQGVKRYLHMSANGTGPEAQTGYHRSKWQAEQAVRASELDWTIIRPSLIFGPGSEFVDMLAGLIGKLPVVPVLGNGRSLMQPVAVGQVAETLVKALKLPATIGQTYLLGGTEAYTYNQILDLTGAALGKPHVAKLHQPLLLIKPIVRMMESFTWFPITGDQLEMLLDGNVCDPTAWSKAFDLVPVSYAQGIGACLRKPS